MKERFNFLKMEKTIYFEKIWFQRVTYIFKFEMSGEDIYDNDILQDNNKLSSSSSDTSEAGNTDIGCDF